MSTTIYSEHPDAAVVCEQWPIQQRPIVDNEALYRMPKKGTFKIISGLAGGPVVIYGDGAPGHRASSATDSPSNPTTTPAFKELMSMWDISKAIRRSYTWVSKNWKKTMQLTPRHVGATLYFKRAEVEGYIERNVLRHRKPAGRHKKIIGILHA